MIQTQKQKIESLQALRAFAFLGVFSFHSGLLDLGAWGVSIFFILSGFLMMLSYYDRMGNDVPSFRFSLLFSLRKIKKLYPLHIVTMLIAVAYMIFDKYINDCLNTDYLKHIVKCMIFGIPLLQTWIPKLYVAFSLNGPSWYLSVSLFLYATFPILLYLLKRKLTEKKAIPMMVIAFTIQTLLAITVGRLTPSERFTNEWSKWYSYVFPLSRAGDFIIGCIAGFLFSKKKNSQGGHLSTLFETLAIALAVISYIIYVKLAKFSFEWFRYTTLMLPGALALVWLFARNNGFFTKVLTNKITIWIGNISPYAFLIHQVVICWINYILRSIFGDVALWLLALINLAITLILSELTHKIIEKKANLIKC